MMVTKKPNATMGKCGCCRVWGILKWWDQDLKRRTCCRCAPHLRNAEDALTEANIYPVARK